MAFVIGRNASRAEARINFLRFSSVLNGESKIFIRKLSGTGQEGVNAESKSAVGKNENEILKSVFVSQSNNVFSNLAIENWLYKNGDFNRHHVLLIWRNTPCVVVGRHQNPWLESNMKFLAENGADIARRNSGGGTVYHDKGNINLTFFTPRERYDRKYNLKIITEALKRKWNMNLEISDKDDLLLNNHKVSGTASKLGRPNAYHHCTLLVDTNKVHLKESLSNKKDEYKTNATKSVPSHVMNLTDENPNLSYDQLLTALGWEYLRTTAISRQDGGEQLISKQRGFQLINPTDQWFPGLNKIRDEFISWDWRFGRTPKFSVTRSFRVVYDPEKSQMDSHLRVTLLVEKGQIVEASFESAEGTGDSLKGHFLEMVAGLRGRRYSSETFDSLEKSIFVSEKENVKTALRA